jgi:cytochrome c1
MKHILVVAVILTLVYSCKETQNTAYASVEKINHMDVHPGKTLMETNCYVCHSPTASQDDRIAPPMIAIKKHYLKDRMTKEEFISEMQEWIKNPTGDNAKMYGAVRRFGLMPKQVYPEETIKQIADYMFDHAIEQPEWFETHFKEMKGKQGKQGKI